MNLIIARPGTDGFYETFIRAHIERLPARIQVVHGFGPAGFHPYIDGRPVRAGSLPTRAARKVRRWLPGASIAPELSLEYLAVFRSHRANAVLAEYGLAGNRVREACLLAGLPLIVHFHGYDAYRDSEVKDDAYRALFAQAAAIVAVSRHMQRQLESLGAPPEKVHYNPYGVDLSRFRASPVAEAPQFLCVGRFVEKKAPHLTLLAFAEALRSQPDARLRMIGDGPLLSLCKEIAGALGLADRVAFLGAVPHEQIAVEMRNARAFLQHSVTAPNGDSEGTPNTVIEAGACGLPVIATHHAGIPDVVRDGATGLLVAERDVPGMAKHIARLAGDRDLAQQLGEAARKRVAAEFDIEKRTGALWRIIQSCVSRPPAEDETSAPDFAASHEDLLEAAHE